MRLAQYLEGKNKSAFARAIGLKHEQAIFAYLPRRDGRPPRRTPSRALALRIVAATEGAVTLEDLFAAPPPRREAA